MTRYFYDEEAGTLIAFDPVAETLRELVHIGDLEDEAEEQEEELPAPKSKGTKRNAGKGCPECGSPSRHRKECSRARRTSDQPGNEEWQKLGDTTGLRPGGMSRDKFSRVKLAAKNDLPSDVIARELTVSLKEVNKAMIATDYDAYLKA